METFKLKFTDNLINLAESVLWSSTDFFTEKPLNDDHSSHDIDHDDLFKLETDYWQFRDRADNVLIEHGRGDTCLEDLWPTKVEHYFVLVREGHGVSFTDDWIQGSKTYRIAQELDRIASSYGPIGAMAREDGRGVFFTWTA